MKKTVFAALAAASLLPAGSWAQVTLSGIIDGGVRLDQGSSGGSIRSQGSGLQTASRLNVSGVEDLGSGLQAAFVLEGGLLLDTGAGTANAPGVAAGAVSFGRTSALAVGSDKTGFVSLGRQYTPLWAVSAGPANDPFGANWLGGIGTVYSTTVRTSNALVYAYGYTARTMLLPAPRKGLGAAVMVAPGETAAPLPTAAGNQFGANLSYGDGDGVWWVGYGYHQVKGSGAAISATAPVTDKPTVRQQTLGASCMVGAARLHVGLNAASNNGTGAAKVDRRNWHVGAVLPFGGLHSVRVLVGQADDRTAANVDFKTWQLGYQYDLSKRSNLYLAAGAVDNSANANAVLTGALGTYAKGANARSLITGVRHSF